MARRRRRAIMKKKEDKIYGHIEPVEVPEEITNLPQWEKWLEAMFSAPIWKKAEYGAQSIAWTNEITETDPMMIDYLRWGVNPLGRA